jgi:hypothetical protein
MNRRAVFAFAGYEITIALIAEVITNTGGANGGSGNGGNTDDDNSGSDDSNGSGDNGTRFSRPGLASLRLQPSSDQASVWRTRMSSRTRMWRPKGRPQRIAF